MQCQRPAAETTEVEACMATYFWFVYMDHQWQAAHRQYKSSYVYYGCMVMTVVEQVAAY